MYRSATGSDSIAVGNVLLASRRAFLPFAPIAHSDESVHRWVRERLIPAGGVTVWEREGQVLAVLATSQDLNASWIDQLYVLPGFVGQGIGTALLTYAHTYLSTPIRLYTFQQNLKARAFYERHGYQAVAFSDGKGNEERCPDVLYEYQDQVAEL